MLEVYLQEFLRFANPNMGSSPYQWQYNYSNDDFTFQLVISSIIHGNEYGSLPAVIELIKKLESGEIYFGGQNYNRTGKSRKSCTC